MENSNITSRRPECLDAKELGGLLSISKRQIRRLSSCAQIPRPIRIGGSVRWVAEEIRDWINAGCPDRPTWESMKGVEK